MNNNIETKNLQLSKEQIETFSFNIFRDIGEYVNENINAYVCWMLESLPHIVINYDGNKTERTDTYKYELCNNGRNEK